VSAPRFMPGTVPDMTTNREVPVDPYLLELATELGFTEVHQIHRDSGLSPLFYARWKGAPVGITHLTGIGGFLGVAFFQGNAVPTPEEIIEGGRFIESRWDDVLDTGWGDAAALRRCWIFGPRVERFSIGTTQCQICRKGRDHR
jgi:hypothetical protein